MTTSKLAVRMVLPMTKQKKLMIVDGNALIHRAFHALPPLKNQAGELVNAVYGFTTILFRALKDLRPSHAVITFDVAGGTFRNKQYAEYKAHRKTQPDELYAQIPMVKDLVHAMGIPTVELKGFEADDVIGTISKQLDKKSDILSIIVTGDMDTLQLVDDNTKVYTMRKGIADTIMYDAKAVMERYGLAPSQMIDYKALRGDPSDNIPGVRGIGEKGAVTLLQKFGSLEGVYKNLQEVTPDGLRKKLEDGKEDAQMSKELATIVTNAPITFSIGDAELKGADREAIVKELQRFGFRSLLTQIDQIPGIVKTIGTGPVLTTSNAETPETELSETLLERAGRAFNTSQFDFGVVAPKTKSQSTPTPSKNGGQQNYVLVDTVTAAKNLAIELKKAKRFVFDTETDSLDSRHTKLLGISFTMRPGEAFYVTHEGVGQVRTVMEDDSLLKIAHNAKFDIHVLEANGINVVGPFWDTMVGSYVMNPGTRQHKLDTLIFLYFGYEMQPITALIGEGKNQISMAEVPVEKVSWYSCEDADFTWRLYEKLKQELTERKQDELLKKIEMPLVPVLTRMENLGVKLDVPFLKKMEKELATDITRLQKVIYKHAGHEFNISSPQQLKVVLFDELQISPVGIGRTKTGLSTAAAELEKLRGEHEIIDLISHYREVTKLQSTYVKALPEMVDPADKRIHTSFNQTIAATGRLSSTDPNLQNIPIRTELGRRIRRAFIAEKGNVILSADYSQIELRVAAHLSGDKVMIEAFQSGEDFHTTTAALIFNKPKAEITKDLRRSAKTINFGVLYGMGSTALAQQTGMNRMEAKEFIQRYHSVYKKLKEYLDSIKDSARELGYVETLWGRRRYVPDILSGVPMVRAEAERAAVNHPLQGTSADMMKLAMLEVDAAIQSGKIPAQMLIQVHDELVFEVAAGDALGVAKAVRERMESIEKLKVPILVDVEVGENWGELKSI